jgi:hypothetical protein
VGYKADEKQASEQTNKKRAGREQERRSMTTMNPEEKQVRFRKQPEVAEPIEQATYHIAGSDCSAPRR